VAWPAFARTRNHTVFFSASSCQPPPVRTAETRHQYPVILISAIQGDHRQGTPHDTPTSSVT